MDTKRAWRAFICCGLLLTAGCGYKTLKFFFDGVPEPGAKPATAPQPQQLPLSSRLEFSEHGPYASRHCEVCHNSDSSNQLVVPEQELCLRCHEFQTQAKYVHGPLMSGGCLVCHDPHNSRYRYLLKSESDHFCFDCHDETSIRSNPAHQTVDGQCTACHEAHMSERRYLLKPGIEK